MQVMNVGEFEQKNVLVGNTGETKGFGVTNDPILMSMLSKGLYGNPLRTMIQEIIFNAWDAHSKRMGNCQDTPIDIYINDTTGLIVRDYGPGIPDEDMHPIYCIYGASTKRDDDGSTGGFGLGSKSPYAYNDSFTVTSHHQNIKNMYLMNRVSEENDGGPGMTAILNNIPTDEKGLMVTVGLKSQQDMNRTYRYLKEILYLSGIKCNVHYAVDGVITEEYIEADSLPAGEWCTSDGPGITAPITAIYGGVKYEIPEHDEYADEWKFVKKFSNLIGHICIGFAPNTLTPLPNREGLNLSESSIEAIRIQLEKIQEQFESFLFPNMKSCLTHAMRSLHASGIQEHFLAYRWQQIGDNIDLKDVIDHSHPVTDGILADRPQDVSESIWHSLTKVCLQHTQRMITLLGYDKFMQMRYVAWVKEMKTHAYKPFLVPTSIRHDYQDLIYTKIQENFSSLISMRNELRNITGQELEIRLPDSDQNFKLTSSKRSAGKLNTNSVNFNSIQILEKLKQDKKLVFPDKEHSDRLWVKSSGKLWNEYMLMDKTIIIAKTVADLNDMAVDYQGIFCPQYPTVSLNHNFSRKQFFGWYNAYPIPAIVIHKKKDGFANAKKHLEAAGWNVQEAPEIEREKVTTKTYVTSDGETLQLSPKNKTKPTYPLLKHWRPGWASDTEIDNPQCYFNMTSREIDSWKQSNKPTTEMLNWITHKYPRTVIIHHKNRAEALAKKGVKTFQKRFEEDMLKILENDEYSRKLILHGILRKKCNLPNTLLKLPEVSKFFGIPPIRTNQKDKFEREFELLYQINRMRYPEKSVSYYLWTQVQAKWNTIKDSEDFSMVLNRLKAAELFASRDLSDFIVDMKPGERKIFSEKLMRFVRTVANNMKG